MWGASPGMGHAWRATWKGDGSCQVLRPQADGNGMLDSEQGSRPNPAQRPQHGPVLSLRYPNRPKGISELSRPPRHLPASGTLPFWLRVTFLCGTYVLSPRKNSKLPGHCRRHRRHLGQPDASGLSALCFQTPPTAHFGFSCQRWGSPTLTRMPTPPFPREHQQMPDGPLFLPAGRHSGCHGLAVYRDRWSL